MDKIKILPSSPMDYDRTGHLIPVMDFLIKNGNNPLFDDFKYDKSGVGELLFEKPLDTFILNQRFDFPENIFVGEVAHYGGGILWDKSNALIMYKG